MLKRHVHEVTRQDQPFSNVENSGRFHDHDLELVGDALETHKVQRPVPVVIIHPAKCLKQNIYLLHILLFLELS